MYVFPSRSPSVESRSAASAGAPTSNFGRIHADSRQSVSPTWGGAAYAALPPVESPSATGSAAGLMEALLYTSDSSFTAAAFAAPDAVAHQFVQDQTVREPTATSATPRTMTPGRASALAAATAAAFTSRASSETASARRQEEGKMHESSRQPSPSGPAVGRTSAGESGRYGQAYELPVDLYPRAAVPPAAPWAGHPSALSQPVAEARHDTTREDTPSPTRVARHQQPPAPEPHPTTSGEQGPSWADELRHADAVVAMVRRAVVAQTNGSRVSASGRRQPHPATRTAAVPTASDPSTAHRRSSRPPRRAGFAKHLVLPLPLPAELRAAEAECARLRMLVALQRDQRLHDLADAHAAHERARAEWSIAQSATERAQREALEGRDAQITDLRMRLVEALRELAERDAAAAAAEEQRQRELDEQRSGLAASKFTRRDLMARARIRDHRAARLNAYRSPNDSTAVSPPRRSTTPLPFIGSADALGQRWHPQQPHGALNDLAPPPRAPGGLSVPFAAAGTAAAARGGSAPDLDGDDIALVELAALEAEAAAAAVGPADSHRPQPGGRLGVLGASHGVAAALTPANEPLYIPAPPVLADSHAMAASIPLASDPRSYMGQHHTPAPAGEAQTEHQLQQQVEHWKQIALRLAAAEGMCDGKMGHGDSTVGGGSLW